MYNETTIDQCLTALQGVVGLTKEDTPLHAPKFCANEWKYVKSCLDTGWVSSVGEYVNLFEKRLADVTGSPFVVVVMNGTAALHIGLILANVQPQNEVLTPSLAFVAAANAISYCGAIPHFVEASFTNLGVDLEKLEIYLQENVIVKNNASFNKLTGRKVKAIIPVHIFGHYVDMERLNNLCDMYYISVIEDASEALGSQYKGNEVGHFSEIAVLSFNGNKIITTGGGGAILFKNHAHAKQAKHLTTTAKRPHRWEFFHDEVGYNYRLPNINAALGCAQLEQLPHFIECKRKLAQKYIEAFSRIENVSILQESVNVKSNYWLNALVLQTPNRKFIEDFIELALHMKCALRGLWTPLNQLPMYRNCPAMDLSETQRLFDSVIALPSSVPLGNQYV